MPIYESAGLDSLIVNIQQRQVERYNLLSPHGRVYCKGDTFAMLDVQIAMSDLFNAVPE